MLAAWRLVDVLNVFIISESCWSHFVRLLLLLVFESTNFCFVVDAAAAL